MYIIEMRQLGRFSISNKGFRDSGHKEDGTFSIRSKTTETWMSQKEQLNGMGQQPGRAGNGSGC